MMPMLLSHDAFASCAPLMRGCAGRLRPAVAPSTAIRWHEEWRPPARAARPQGGDRWSHVTEVHAAQILKILDETGDITLTERSPRPAARCRSRRASFRLEKRPATRPNRTDRTSARRRAGFASQDELDPQRLIFIDETWASRKMARSPGRAGCAWRCRTATGRRRPSSPGSRYTGLSRRWCSRAINGRTFEAYVEAYVEAFLVPALARRGGRG